MRKCLHDVVDFTSLTRKEAERILTSAASGICGRLASDRHGHPIFRPEPDHGRLVRIAGLSLAAISGLAAQSTCKLEVNAKDPLGAAIAGAQVSLKQGKPGKTDENGSYTADVQPGKNQITVQIPGFETLVETVDVSCEKPTTIEATLKIPDVTLGLIVFNPPEIETLSLKTNRPLEKRRSRVRSSWLIQRFRGRTRLTPPETDPQDE